MPTQFDIIPLSSKNFSERDGVQINTIIVHCSGNPLSELFKVFDDYKVSAHYVVPQITASEKTIFTPPCCL